MRLSIIVPCFNMEAYLPTCLDSVLVQGFDPGEYEIIVVNDESKDRTLNIAKDYEQRHSNLKVIDKSNAGVGAARNSGLDAARGSYVYFLDPDDYLARNQLNSLLEMAENLQLDILSFISREVGKDEYIPLSATECPPSEPKVKDGITYIADRKFQNEIWWYLIRRDFMIENNLRFIEGRWMEDAILTAQLFCSAQRIAHVPQDVHRYRILPTSAMRNKSPEHYNKVIYDNANAAHVFDDLIRSIPTDHPRATDCIKRLKTRQQSFVFFLMIRLLKSDLPIDEIPKMLPGFSAIDAYPLKKFLGEDYHGFSYTIMVYILNRPYLINPFAKVFRTFYSFVK